MNQVQSTLEHVKLGNPTTFRNLAIDTLTISDHASRRMQQRGIPPLIVEWLRDYGSIVHDKHGGVIHHFDKRARRSLEKRYGRTIVKRLAEFLDCYAVFAEGRLVTTGRRYKRLRH